MQTQMQIIRRLDLKGDPLLRARRMALRSRAAMACVPCKARKSKCSDHRPCKRCKSAGGTLNCLDTSSPQSKSSADLSSPTSTSDHELNCSATSTMLYSSTCFSSRQPSGVNYFMQHSMRFPAGNPVALYSQNNVEGLDLIGKNALDPISVGVPHLEFKQVQTLDEKRSARSVIPTTLQPQSLESSTLRFPSSSLNACLHTRSPRPSPLLARSSTRLVHAASTPAAQEMLIDALRSAHDQATLSTDPTFVRIATPSSPTPSPTSAASAASAATSAIVKDPDHWHTGSGPLPGPRGDGRRNFSGGGGAEWAWEAAAGPGPVDPFKADWKHWGRSGL
jgi:hypothetical protein